MPILHDLSTADMIFLLETLLNHPPIADLWMKQATLAGFRPPLESTLSALQHSRPSAISSPSTRAELRDLLRTLDLQHDSFNTAIYRVLGLLADLLPGKASELLSLQAQLFPHALRINQMSRPEEVAEAQRMEKQLQASPSARQILDSIEVSFGSERFNLGKLADQLFATADAMKTALQDLVSSDKDSRTKPDSEPRQAFVSWISRFRETAQLVLKDDKPSLQLLFRALDERLAASSPTLK